MATMAHEPLEDEQDALRETFSEELIRHWMNERLAPEVLAHQEDLMERALSRIQQQSLALDVLANNPEGLSSSDHFRFMLIETEIEHARYICKAYARCRMYKLDKFFDHCLMDPETRSRLSKVDLEYCAREQTLVHNLLYDSVLDQLPIKYRKLDEDHMIIRPNLDQGVFIIVRSSCGPAVLPHTEPLMLEKGSKHFICYRSIKPFLESGHVKLV
ncbi:hypothetical protein MJO28_006349 [Puccinia striiformis f. sp. tritici]|uniref:Uncharacterized protein n=1 Tax=Puccinia striiformis f. sp. tritici TaxID=168172 RepID=A0ACC0EIF1_9BASI|nr:hypothetical protein MJO28_006349 [Puccinia striiformis f. sp. tritici]